MSYTNVRLMLAAAAAACIAAGCVQNFQKPAERAMPDTRAADEAAIRAGDADFVKAAEAKDLEKCMSLYADDAVFLASGIPAAVGKDNIRKDIQGLLAAPGLQFTVNIASVTVARSGDLAIDQGTVGETYTDKKGQPVTGTSQYVLVWKKMPDGSWKIAADTSANQK
jgi:uncharacterized protein (TIGR02246 family)